MAHEIKTVQRGDCACPNPHSLREKPALGDLKNPQNHLLFFLMLYDQIGLIARSCRICSYHLIFLASPALLASPTLHLPPQDFLSASQTENTQDQINTSVFKQLRKSGNFSTTANKRASRKVLGAGWRGGDTSQRS